ncbi:hypothetical protein I4J05_00760 [Corynebacterium diphtheriae bv. mitis]|uniref:hypothetical protein n=1 Tax=Corynebacterium diphtheriae TaxID=1717 RepID=UPI0013CA8A6E|nr:hypothetical protein [Corynebacterium diphtheriae]MBG9273646.1 hypothetical protein [Corynebacterium diphtheriae bv. mitis]CAB0514780.1 hypothetical protein CIP103987_01502 [Corynebacterium diphtheriae]CAB0559634.1 hypothetical protein CIP107526_01499 [Corynebacterium diphtheriae]CAB0780433.1 hypothetical protein FRC0182_01533 [Corynebacterium diphtheriae]CAB1041035.1 hypothetical protein FRC0552_01550 [Corynebacterium diphtheriae]
MVQRRLESAESTKALLELMNDAAKFVDVILANPENLQALIDIASVNVSQINEIREQEKRNKTSD